MKPFAQIRGDEILHLSCNERVKEIERLNKYIDALRSEIANYEKARQEDARWMEQVTAERNELFNVAVKAFSAVEIHGGVELHGQLRQLDKTLTRLSPELWKRVDAAALKGGKG